MQAKGKYMQRTEIPSATPVNSLEELFNLSADMLFVAKLDGCFETVNPSFSCNLGYSTQALLGFSFYELMHPDDRLPSFQQLEEAATHNENKAIFFTSRYRCQSGNYINIGWSVTVKDNSIYGVGHNLTQLQNMQFALKDLRLHYNHDLQENAKYNKKHANMISELCHELRNPLSGIAASASLAQDIRQDLTANLQDPPMLENKLKALQEMLDNIELCAEQQKYLLDDFLDFSKLEVNKLKLAKAPFNVSQALQDAVAILKHKAQEKQLYLKVETSNENIWVRGDMYRLRQIILNLVSNAIKFTQQGGVTVRLASARYSNGHAYLSIAVEDTGMGLTAQAREKLFKHFSQTSDFIATQYGGTGLGLYITKKLVGLMKGTISVDSELDKGSVFTFTVCCKQLTEQERLQYQQNIPRLFKQHSSTETRRYRVLIVDDNIINQKILRKIVEQGGHEVAIANDGISALEMIFPLTKLPAPFDIVFMDINMPIMDGLSATRTIRQREKEDGLKALPIIGLSGNALQRDKEIALQAGMNDYVVKPFQKEQLLHMITQYCMAGIGPSVMPKVNAPTDRNSLQL